LNKKKIINDPIYGFITIPDDLIFDIIEHPFFQRLRRIRQLGLSDLIYPGATHSRFHHALGAMHLMQRTLITLKSKGHVISEEEYQAASIAILLHDIGHGPFSHSLEFSLMPDIAHEKISLMIMEEMNRQFSGKLALAIEMFTDQYPRTFFHQLVASQLDIDRLDYLRRDSFFTGVQEGTIGAERIIKMLNIVDDKMVVEEKGIYSIENFLSARRLMYWQVYLHKAALSAEVMLVSLVNRARFLMKNGHNLQATPALSFFLQKSNHASEPELLKRFTQLDDGDIWGSIKFWVDSDDFVLKKLSQQVLNRQLFRIHVSNEKIKKENLNKLTEQVADLYNLSVADAKFFVQKGKVSNAAYVSKNQTINILTKSGQVTDVAHATDLPNIKAMSKIVKKHYACFPKELSL